MGVEDVNHGFSVSGIKYIESRFEAIEKATNIAYEANNKRLESMNEFRQQINDMLSSFLRRDEYNLRHEALLERLQIQEANLANLQGRLWIVLIIPVAIDIAIHFLGK